MARRSQMTMLKRQREVRKAEKAARKRARRHGQPEPGVTEPRATVHLGETDVEGDPASAPSAPEAEKPGS